MWVMLPDFKRFLRNWRSNTFSAKGCEVWRLVPAAICWTKWKDCNNRAFEIYTMPSYMAYQWEKDTVVVWAVKCEGCHDVGEMGP